MSQSDVTTNLGQYNSANSMAPTLAELRPQPTLAARVYTLVKEAVISGELAPGSYHTEAAMARVLVRVRAPLREVLQRLQEEGLVEETQRPGFAITSITPKSILELYETRFALEGFAAAKAAGNIPAGDIEAMRQAQEAAAVPLGKGDPGPFLELEFEFHNLWLRNSGNDLLVRHVDRLRDHVRRCSRSYAKTSSTRREPHMQSTWQFSTRCPARRPGGASGGRRGAHPERQRSNEDTPPRRAPGAGARRTMVNGTSTGNDRVHQPQTPHLRGPAHNP